MEAAGGFMWSVFVLTQKVSGGELEGCSLPIVAQAVALMLATLFPAIAIVGGFISPCFLSF